MTLTAEQALTRLREGNDRFARGEQDFATQISQHRRDQLVAGQAPFAAVLGCSDSRAPVEILFDQGLGDLFVIRVAGNVVASSQVGSVEFAAAQFGLRLVVVLGHSRCGAVQATVGELQREKQAQSPHLRSIVDRIRPAVSGVLEASPEDEPEALLERAVRANVRMAAAQLRNGSAILEQLIAEQGLRVVGAEYSLETGRVSFFDGVDEISSQA